MIVAGQVHGGLAQLRDLLRRTQRLTCYQPRIEEDAWAVAETRLQGTA